MPPESERRALQGTTNLRQLGSGNIFFRKGQGILEDEDEKEKERNEKVRRFRG